MSYYNSFELPLTISELKENHSDQLGDLLDSPLLLKAESMEGALRNVSTHAAGIIIGKRGTATLTYNELVS